MVYTRTNGWCNPTYICLRVKKNVAWRNSPVWHVRLLMFVKPKYRRHRLRDVPRANQQWVVIKRWDDQVSQNQRLSLSLTFSWFFSSSFFKTSPTKDPSSTYSPTEAPATFTRWECNGNAWHMSRSQDNTCTNDDDYPDTWNHETLSGYFLSDSPEGCCEMNYFGTCCYYCMPQSYW